MGRNRLFWKMDSNENRSTLAGAAGEQAAARAATSSTPCAAAVRALSAALPGGGGGPVTARTASGGGVGAVVAVAAAREWAERSWSRPAAGRRAGVVLAVRSASGSSRNAVAPPGGRPRSGGGTAGRGAAVAVRTGEGWGLAPRAAARGWPGAGGRPGVRRRPGRREPCVTVGVGGGEILWPVADAASVLRGEVVLPMLSGNSDRGFGLMLGAGDGRLGLGLGGFPLEEVVGHLKAQSTCF